MSHDLLAEALGTLLACPVCHGEIQLESLGAQQVRCLTCGRRYPIDDGIPVLFGNGGIAQRDEQAFRDALAEEYLDDSPQALLNVATRCHCEPVMRKRAGEFYGRFDSSQWVLDLGVGYGWYWAGSSGAAKIVGVDMSMGNLRLAKKLLSAEEDRVLLVCCDAAALPIRNHRISGVWSVQVFQHFPQGVLAAVQEELDRVLLDKFFLEIHNLNPAVLYRLVHFVAGKSFCRRGHMGSMERNCYTMQEWNELWRLFRKGRVETSGSYSELFFHPDLHLRIRPYPLLLEEFLARLAPKFSELFARQVQVRIESRGLNSAAVRLAAGSGMPPECALAGSVGAGPSWCKVSVREGQSIRERLASTDALTDEKRWTHMTEAGRALCESIYCPPETKTGWRFDALLEGREYRFYSYGRRALVEALRIAGVTRGSTVALPTLICRELLSAVHACGGVPSFYPVGKDLNLDAAAAELPACKAVVAVNYFGFPQELSPFQEHCQRTGAVLIEDNAHGLFSRDSAGAFLGLRGDLGLFSLRKTLPIPNGAALVVNVRGHGFSLGHQQGFDSRLPPLAFLLKQSARRIAPVVGWRTLHRLHKLLRQCKRAAGAFTVGAQNAGEEGALPQPERPSIVLSHPLTMDIEREMKRRRALYRWIDDVLRNAGFPIATVFPCLGDSVVPYGYPFYTDDITLHKVRAVLDAYGLECLSWPDLPDAVRDKAPSHYKTLRMVAFLW